MLEALEAIDATQPCWVGKTPAQGDFISHNLTPASEKALLDEMTQALANTAANHSQNDWIEAFLTTPLWHVVISRAWDDKVASMACLIIPSIDKVDRLYPLLMAMPWNDNGNSCDEADIGQRFVALYGALAGVYPPDLLTKHPNGLLKQQVSAIYLAESDTEPQIPAQLLQDDPADNAAEAWFWIVAGDTVCPVHHLQGCTIAGLFDRIFPRPKPKADILAIHDREVI